MFEQAPDAAKSINSAWMTAKKLDQLPGKQSPRTVAEGYAIQAALAAHRAEPVLGWKIAATSKKGQKHIGVDAPLGGRLFQSRCVESGAHISMAGNAMAAAECEFVFRLGSDLPPRPEAYSRDEVMTAVASLHPGLELPDSRFRSFARAGAPQLVADNACTHWMVIGGACQADWRGTDLALHATSLLVNGSVVTRGTGADVLGDPRDALTWLANSHQWRGEGLTAGQYITTGVTGEPSAVSAGCTVEANLGTFGNVVATLVE
jgi:2-keto-4-pentenoate hydratase